MKGWALIAVAALLGGAALWTASRSRCADTFVYTVAIENPVGQEDWRADVAVLADGLERVITDDHAATGAAISPDGERVVVEKGRGSIDSEYEGIARAGLFLYGSDGSFQRPLTDSRGSHPDWSPNGEQIAFIDGRSVAVVDVEGRAERVLYEIPAHERGRRYLIDVSWSGDSERVAFATGPLEAGVSKVYSVRRDGTDLRQHLRVEEDAIHHLAWSPDGRWFAWNGSFRGTRSVVMARTSGGAPPIQVEPNSQDPVWSRSGDLLAYVIGHEGHYESRIVVGDDMGRDEAAVPIGDAARGGASLEDWASCGSR